ncbi:vWA domain-containing protein [Mailhella sp.]
MIDFTQFTLSEPKPFLVMLLLDISGSMYGDKITELNRAAQEMIDAFSKEEKMEVEIRVSIITFGGKATLQLPFTKASLVHFSPLQAEGGTPLGAALKIAKNIMEDRSSVPGRAYRPIAVLVSDGQPNDDWKSPLKDFISNGRSSKCDRMAIAIGSDADRNVLGLFVANTENPILTAHDAANIRESFKAVTMSVTQQVRQKTRNAVPDLANNKLDPTRHVSQPVTPVSSEVSPCPSQTTAVSQSAVKPAQPGSLAYQDNDDYIF